MLGERAGELGVAHCRGHDILAWLGTARITHMGKAHLGQLGIVQALLAEIRTQARQAFGVVTRVDPRRADVGQALAHRQTHPEIEALGELARLACLRRAQVATRGS